MSEILENRLPGGKVTSKTHNLLSLHPNINEDFFAPLIFARLPTPLIFKRVKCGRERGAQTIKVVKKCL